MLVVELNIKSINYDETFQYSGWQEAIKQEVESIQNNNT